MKITSNTPLYSVLILLLTLFLSCDNDESLPVVNTVEVLEVTTNSASSGGEIIDNGGKTITERGVCWSTDNTPTIEDNKTSDGSGLGLYSSNITGLNSSTSYYVRAYATNSDGTSYGSTIHFSTLNGNYESTFTDSRDGQVYKAVEIGSQIWMAENLKYLPSVASPDSSSESVPYHYVYGYDGNSLAAAKNTFNYNNFGVLYNWTAAVGGSNNSSSSNPSGIQGACPNGWHLPSNAEWNQLTDYLGSVFVANLLKEQGVDNWESPNAAINSTGFTALPGGRRFTFGQTYFFGIGTAGHWWTSTSPININVEAYSKSLQQNRGDLINFQYNKEDALSIRCVKDE